MSGASSISGLLSFVVPVGPYCDDLSEIHEGFRAEAERLGRPCEFVFVLDRETGPLPGLEAVQSRTGVRVVRVFRRFDDSIAMKEGFRRAQGAVVVTLPSYHSVDPTGLGPLLAAVDAGAACALAVRRRRRDPLFNRLQSGIFHRLVSRIAGRPLRDITNGTRALRREVARQVQPHGDQHRYLPVLILARGLAVVEVEVPQSPGETALRVFGPRTYLYRLMDLLAIFFVLRFTQRPLRFFGAAGAVVMTTGGLYCAVLAAQRIFGGRALADRPALLLGMLLIVLGVQMASIGLLGELMVYLGLRRPLDPLVEEVSGEEPADDFSAGSSSEADPGR